MLPWNILRNYLNIYFLVLDDCITIDKVQYDEIKFESYTSIPWTQQFRKEQNHDVWINQSFKKVDMLTSLFFLSPYHDIYSVIWMKIKWWNTADMRESSISNFKRVRQHTNFCLTIIYWHSDSFSMQTILLLV